MKDRWNPIFCLVETVFWSEIFLASGNHYWNWGETVFKERAYFLPSGNSIFCQCYFAATRNHYWNKEKTVLRETAHSSKWTTDFPASGKHFFFSLFWKPLPVFFRLVEKHFYKIFWFSASGNKFRANNDAHKQKKSCK